MPTYITSKALYLHFFVIIPCECAVTLQNIFVRFDGFVVTYSSAATLFVMAESCKL